MHSMGHICFIDCTIECGLACVICEFFLDLHLTYHFLWKVGIWLLQDFDMSIFPEMPYLYLSFHVDPSVTVQSIKSDGGAGTINTRKDITTNFKKW